MYVNTGLPAIFYCIGIRLLKESGVSLASEVSMQKIADEMNGNNLEGEVAQLSFWWGGNPGNSSSVCPNLIQKIIQTLDEHDR